MDLTELLSIGVRRNASDVHLTVGIPPTYRVDGALISLVEKKLTTEDTLDLVKQALDETRLKKLNETGEIDFSYSIPSIGRFRVNAFKQRGSYALVLRIIPLEIPLMDELGLPSILNDLSKLPRGLILVTGPTGSGKTTTLASIINKINSERKCHIITLEDPLEYLHKHKKSIVNQREVGSDTQNFANGLRGALREDPDVILVGEMRDLETISTGIIHTSYKRCGKDYGQDNRRVSAISATTNQSTISIGYRSGYIPAAAAESKRHRQNWSL